MKTKIFLVPLMFLTTLLSCGSAHPFDRNESNKRLVFSCTNNTNTSYAGIEARYEDNGITINLELEDSDLYAKNIYDIGYDDNVEFIIGEQTTSTSWVVGKSYHFLINGAGKIYYQVANSGNSFGPSLDPSLHVVLGENLIVNFKTTKKTDYGFDGFKASVFLSYDVMNTVKEFAFGKLSICPAMRNTHNYGSDTTWMSYANRGCNWSDPSKFVPINANNEFKN